jgi:DNA-binding SARP family transcriptional activator
MANQRATARAASGLHPTVLICLFGAFRVTNSGQDVAIARGSKVETLLTYLALRHRDAIARELLLSALWPECDAAHAGQSLNSLVYSVQKLFENVPAGAAPVVQANGYYRLNEQAGVSVDVALFCEQADVGDSLVREGAAPGAAAAYEQAAAFYRGDLCASADLNALLEREHLRARFLGILSWLADYHFGLHQYHAALKSIHLLLTSDACREDAHRLAMRCYVRIGQRAQALRQYQLCSKILQNEFDAEPEPATAALYHQVRLDPGAI